MVEHPGARWRQIIEDAGTTQAAVARAVGVSRRTVNMMVNGHILPSAELTTALAEHLQVDAEKMWHARALYEFQLHNGNGHRELDD